MTFRVLRSKQRRANDWKDYRICFRGKALSPAAVILWDSTDNMMAINWGKPPLIVIDVTVAGIRHVSTPTVWGQSDFTSAEANFATISTDHPITESEKQLAERGKRLLSSFATTMTARGNPGSGATHEQRQAAARRRLIEAAHELLHDDPPSPITVIYLASSLIGVTTQRAVYKMLDRAGWEIEDVQEAVNSVHTGCRDDR
jgi:hypothetical protein